MVFQEGDEGPFWMSPQERESRKFDKGTGKIKKRELTIKELGEKLLQQGYTGGGRKKALQQAAQARGIPTTEEYEDILEGWLGKPKGLLQVCWERGLLDPNENIDKVYTINGRKDALGVLNLDFSLKSLLGSCVDFDEEETMLQSMGWKMGALID